MRSCKEFVEVMPDYLQRQLDPALTRGLDHHLADCPRCLDVVAEELITAYREAADHLVPGAVAVTGTGSALR